MNDRLFMAQLDKFCKDKDEYDSLWTKTKQYSQLVSRLYEKQNPKPAPAQPATAPKSEKPAPAKPSTSEKK